MTIDAGRAIRKLGVLVIVFSLLLLIALILKIANETVPTMHKVVLYIAPQFFGLGIMLYIVLRNKEKLKNIESQERSLLASQERFEYLYFSSPVPYINIDSKGEIFLVNLAAIRLFDTTEQRLIGTRLVEYLRHDSDTKLSIILNQLENRMSLSDVELQLKSVDGSIKWVLLSAFAYGNKNELLVSLVDITRQKEVDMAKTEFVTLASHQLRTPIAATRWNFELLSEAQTERTAEQELYFDRVNRNIERLTSLVNDFLHVSKLELGTFATDVQRIQLNSFIASALEEFEKMVKEKGLTVNFTCDPKDLEGDFDPRLLRIVVTNLVSNAVKYTPIGGVVTVSCHKFDHEIVFEVADSGIGVPPNEIEKLFSRFYRATNAQLQHVEGTGLGLYIVRQAVEKMGGSITVNSTLGKGTAFSFRLPV